jgi:hypothetical protein
MPSRTRGYAIDDRRHDVTPTLTAVRKTGQKWKTAKSPDKQLRVAVYESALPSFRRQRDLL